MSTDQTFTIEENFLTTEIPLGTADAGNDRSTIQLFILSFKMAVGLIGVFGNIMACVIFKQLKSQEVKFLIVSQAIIDLLTSAVLTARTVNELTPFPVPYIPIIGHLYCVFWSSSVLDFCLFAQSTYNLVAISIERYLAVLYPIWYRTNFSRKKAILLGIIAWTLAPVSQLVYGIPQRTYSNGACFYLILNSTLLAVLGAMTFFWDFFFPCVIMGFCFTRISLELQTQDKKSALMQSQRSTRLSSISKNVASGSLRKKGGDEQGEGKIGKESSADLQRSRNVSRTFLIVFLAFLICWSTNQCLFLQYNLGGYMYFGKPENYFANSMAIINCACNPFIYVLHLKQYRDVLKSFFRCS